MLSAEEIAAVPLFSSLTADQRDELARTSADMMVPAGEYIVNEGDGPALFVVISGKIDVTKIVDGIERKIGERHPGRALGEVPIVYGTQFPANGRAAEPSRVMRIEARRYYGLVAHAPGLLKAIGDLARERIAGLQNIAAEQRKVQATLLGHQWDANALELRRFLASNQIIFDWVRPEMPEAQGFFGRAPTEDEMPALRCLDGSVLVRPSTREVARQLGLQTGAHLSEYDTVIIGGGPAGLAAAVYGASEGLRTVVVEREAPGGQAGTSSRIENYLGFPNGISGDELASRALHQARRLGAEVVVTRHILRIDPIRREVVLDGDEVLKARTIILATGVSWRRVPIEGFDKLIGRGIYYGASRSEAGITQGLNVHLIGAGNSAGQAAMFFANHARTVTLIVRGDALEKSMSQYLIDQIRRKPNIRVVLEREVAAVHGTDHLEAIDIADRDGKTVREDCAGLFVFIGADAETDWLPPEIARDARGYVLTGPDLLRNGLWHDDREPLLLETSAPGIFACGDVRYSPVKRVAAAVGEGSMAIAFVHQFLARQAAKKAEPERKAG